jgi:hypothetical protein
VAVLRNSPTDFHGASTTVFCTKVGLLDSKKKKSNNSHNEDASTMVVSKLMKAFKGRKRDKVAVEERRDINEGKLYAVSIL